MAMENGAMPSASTKLAGAGTESAPRNSNETADALTRVVDYMEYVQRAVLLGVLVFVIFCLAKSDTVEVLIEEDQSSLWAVGVGLSILGTVVSALGDNLVKYSHRVYAPGDMKGNMIFIFGWMCSMLFGLTCTLTSYAFASPEMVMPMGGLHIVWGVLFARLINGDRAPWAAFEAVAIIFGGVMVILIESDKSTPKYSPDQLRALLMAPGAIAALLFWAFAIAFVLALHRWVVPPTMVFARSVCASLAAGFAGTISNCLAMAISHIIADAKPEDRVYSTFFAWGVICSAIAIAFVQVLCLNFALKHYDATVVIPVTIASLVGIGTCNASFVFQSYHGMSYAALGAQFTGLIVIVVGVLLLGRHYRHGSKAKDKEEPGVDLPYQQVPQDTQGVEY